MKNDQRVYFGDHGWYGAYDSKWRERYLAHQLDVADKARQADAQAFLDDRVSPRPLEVLEFDE